MHDTDTKNLLPIHITLILNSVINILNHFCFIIILKHSESFISVINILKNALFLCRFSPLLLWLLCCFSDFGFPPLIFLLNIVHPMLILVLF